MVFFLKKHLKSAWNILQVKANHTFYGFVFCAVLLFIFTVMALQKSSFINMHSEGMFFLLITNVASILIILVFVMQKLSAWRSHLKGKNPPKLHNKVIKTFSFLLILPSILTLFFAVGFINLVIESWFNNQVKEALYNAQEVAESYLKEHKKVIRENAVNIAAYIENNNLVLGAYDEFSKSLTNLVEERDLDSAIVFNDRREIIWKSKLAFNLLHQPVDDQQLIQSASSPVLVDNLEQNDRVRALIRIKGNTPIYLLVSQFVDAKVLDHLSKTHQIAKNYDFLHSIRDKFKLQFILVFLGVAIVLIFVVVFFSTVFCNRLVDPISELISAAEQIKNGDLRARVKLSNTKDELGLLSYTFNQMAQQLEQQKYQLLEINTQVKQRMQFTESVLSGVKAGVIGLDAKQLITIVNNSALSLLQLDSAQVLNAHLCQLIPEMKILFDDQEIALKSREIHFNNNTCSKILMVQMTSLYGDTSTIEGYVITFDDISDLMQAQRQAAWADVGRRIAHEVKNPLTPILLATERLNKKFLPQIIEGKEQFSRYLATISRQVEQVLDLVVEFSEFTRMPAAKIGLHDLWEICVQVIQIYRSAYPQINFQLHKKTDDTIIAIDANQIERCITNLVKNAAEVVQSSETQTSKGIISATLENSENNILTLSIEDNGPGFPVDNTDSLLEPYVTYKKMGTGLGLSIVKRTMDEHNGEIILGTSPLGGALIRLCFSKNKYNITHPYNAGALEHDV